MDRDKFAMNCKIDNLDYITTDTLLLFCYVKAITAEFKNIILGL